MLGIVVPSLIEAKSLTYHKILPGQFHQVNENILLCLSGQGHSNAKIAAYGLIEKGAKVLISWGLAGGVAPNINPGTLILPKIIYHESEKNINSDVQLIACIKKSIPRATKVCDGGILQVNKVITTSKEKAKLASDLICAIDMESYTIAKVAQKENVSFCCVRVVIDHLSDELPQCIINCQEEKGNLSIKKLSFLLFNNPCQIPRLIRLAKNFMKAKRALCYAASSLNNIFNDIIEGSSQQRS